MLLRRDDHVLVSTRLIALVIIPFLVGAFVILYCFPRHSARLFAWPIKPTMTSMMLASAYLGGAYFFVRVLWYATGMHRSCAAASGPALKSFYG